MTAQIPEDQPRRPRTEDPPRRGGRPRKPIDLQLVETLSEAQLTVVEISHVVGVSTDTLERRCMEVLKRGRSKGVAHVRRELYACAIGNGRSKAACVIFFLKNYGGCSDNVTITGPNDGPILFKDMSDEELDQYIHQQLTKSGIAAQIDSTEEHSSSAGGEEPPTPEK
jgi:hypothetical protein